MEKIKEILDELKIKYKINSPFKLFAEFGKGKKLYFVVEFIYLTENEIRIEVNNIGKGGVNEKNIIENRKIQGELLIFNDEISYIKNINVSKVNSKEEVKYILGEVSQVYMELEKVNK